MSFREREEGKRETDRFMQLLVASCRSPDWYRDSGLTNWAIPLPGLRALVLFPIPSWKFEDIQYAKVKRIEQTFIYPPPRFYNV